VTSPLPDAGTDPVVLARHLQWHLTDGRWHDDCRWCLTRREFGGDGLSEAERSVAQAYLTGAGQ
jgi:hypothetical protein